MSRRIISAGLSAAQVQAILAESDYATTSDVATAVADLVNSAPEALNTLGELAAALGDDENFATTVTNAIGNKIRTDAGVTVVTHGANAATVRPAGSAIVYWVGSVEPTNAANADLWYDTTGDPAPSGWGDPIFVEFVNDGPTGPPAGEPVVVDLTGYDFGTGTGGTLYAWDGDAWQTPTTLRDSGAPDPAVGDPGDFYVDIANPAAPQIYGPKV